MKYKTKRKAFRAKQSQGTHALQKASNGNRTNLETPATTTRQVFRPQKSQ
jgi:hypothetical protein